MDELNEVMELDAEETAIDEQDTTESTDLSAMLQVPEIQEVIQKLVAEGIQKALKGKTPKINTTDPTTADKIAFDRMGYKDRLILFNSNPTKYNKLTGGNI